MENYLLDTNHASPLVTLGHPLRQRVLMRLLYVITEGLAGWQQSAYSCQGETRRDFHECEH